MRRRKYESRGNERCVGRKDNKKAERDVSIDKESKEHIDRNIIIRWMSTKREETLESDDRDKTINKKCGLSNTYIKRNRIFIPLKENNDE